MGLWRLYLNPVLDILKSVAWAGNCMLKSIKQNVLLCLLPGLILRLDLAEPGFLLPANHRLMLHRGSCSLLKLKESVESYTYAAHSSSPGQWQTLGTQISAVPVWRQNLVGPRFLLYILNYSCGASKAWHPVWPNQWHSPKSAFDQGRPYLQS